MDEMTYQYDKVNQSIYLQQNTTISYTLINLVSNKLYKVTDNVNASFYADDIDNQSAGNYTYDNLGNLIKDNAEKIDEITWTNSGKINTVNRTIYSEKADMVFGYDETDQRLWKLVIPKEEITPSTIPKKYKRKKREFWDTTWYFGSVKYKLKYKRDNANTSTLYKQWNLEEMDISGAKRHGLLKPDEVISYRKMTVDMISGYTPEGDFSGTVVADPKQFTIKSSTLFYLQRGNKQYELANHLGNVLVTVSDRKGSRQLTTTTGNNADYYMAYILSITDYYCYGSVMQERTYSALAYRYGFNNQEQDAEMGEYYAFEYRIHDARLGRFLSVDPLEAEYPWNSSYSFAENRVIQGIDLEGKEFLDYRLLGDNNNDATGSPRGVKQVDGSGNPVLSKSGNELWDLNLNGLIFKNVELVKGDDGNEYFDIGQHLYYNQALADGQGDYQVIPNSINDKPVTIMPPPTSPNKVNQVVIELTGVLSGNSVEMRPYPVSDAHWGDGDADEDGLPDLYSVPLYKGVVKFYDSKGNPLKDINGNLVPNIDFEYVKYSPYLNYNSNFTSIPKAKCAIAYPVAQNTVAMYPPTLPSNVCTEYFPKRTIANRPAYYTGAFRVKSTGELFHEGPRYYTDAGAGGAGCQQYIGNFDLFQMDIAKYSGSNAWQYQYQLYELVKLRKLKFVITDSPKPPLIKTQ